MEYLKNPKPHNLLGNILVMEEITIKITGINNLSGWSIKPKSPELTLEKGEILICRGGSDSVFHIALLKEGITVEMPFGEYDRTKTSQVGDCVRINTTTGHQIGKVKSINPNRDWIMVTELRGTQEFPNHPAGDSMYIGMDDILAIDGNFDRIFTNCGELKKKG